ncbi:hypothetical protein J3458_014628 [Metarhizium acridum]|uniref:uncharacterized protein n=1 Tax=Metarhizium acridum TaxID=92637 RepID=UPI001C6C6ECA|nr:hypothetical protein J3458_014628 [Metarhizium acridum]
MNPDTGFCCVEKLYKVMEYLYPTTSKEDNVNANHAFAQNSTMVLRPFSAADANVNRSTSCLGAYIFRQPPTSQNIYALSQPPRPPGTSEEGEEERIQVMKS